MQMKRSKRTRTSGFWTWPSDSTSVPEPANNATENLMHHTDADNGTLKAKHW